jgi:(p)ppGpp synthase/HD superfamily hydrolase
MLNWLTKRGCPADQPAQGGEDMTTLEKDSIGSWQAALAFARVAHAGQTYAGGADCLDGHVVPVAITVAAHGGSPVQVVAALLHNTVEDSGKTPKDIENGAFRAAMRIPAMPSPRPTGDSE